MAKVPVVAVADSSRRVRAHSVEALTIASRLRGTGSQLFVSALRARYESALEDLNFAKEGLMAAAHSSDAAVELAAITHQALARAADVSSAAVRTARHVYTAAVEVNNRVQGDLLDARDRLSTAWAADDDRDEGIPSDGSDDAEGSVASEA